MTLGQKNEECQKIQFLSLIIHISHIIKFLFLFLWNCILQWYCNMATQSVSEEQYIPYEYYQSINLESGPTWDFVVVFLRCLLELLFLYVCIYFCYYICIYTHPLLNMFWVLSKSGKGNGNLEQICLQWFQDLIVDFVLMVLILGTTTSKHEWLAASLCLLLHTTHLFPRKPILIQINLIK